MYRYSNTLLTIIALLLIQTAFAQKVKLKDEKVYVDKEHKYNFIESENKSNGSLSSYELTTLDGKIILGLKDTIIYFSQLLFELSPRPGYELYHCVAPQQSLSALMPYNPVMGYPKQRIKDLKKVGFFKSGEMSEEAFNDFIERQYPKYVSENIEEIHKISAQREKNYQTTKELFGEFIERHPKTPQVVININKPKSYILKEGNTVLGKFNLEVEGSNNNRYGLINHHGTKIGEVNIFKTPATAGSVAIYKYNLKPFILGQSNDEENYIWFNERTSNTSSAKSTNFKLEKIANYLVSRGMM